MIYVIKTKNLTPAFIKIGFARKSMAGRISSLQTGCPHELELIFAKNGGLKEEKELHSKLEKHRANGEWFHWNKETQAEFKLSENPTPLNPSSPEKFLTPRQKQINHLFRKCRTNENWLYVQSLTLFLGCHQYSKKELLEFPVNKARFVIFESTADKIVEMVGAVQTALGDENRKESQLFICGTEVINWKHNS